MQLSQSPRIHPLIAAAAVSVIVVCLLGTAVLAKMIPLAPPIVSNPVFASAVTPARALSMRTVDVAAMPTPPTTAIPAPANASVILVTPEPQNVRPAFDMPASRVEELAVLPAVSATSPVVPSASPTREHADDKALRPSLLQAGRHGTRTLAQTRAPHTRSEEDLPVQLRPEQREAARKATTALARMSQAIQEPGAASPGEATSRLHTE